MPKIEYKTVVLKDIIDFSNCKTNGSEFTKTFVNQNKGDIPVYGASKDAEEIGYGCVKDNLVIKKGNRVIPVKYFENCLTWNIDGSIALFYRKGRFSLSEKVIPLILFEKFAKTIDLEYLKIFISQSAEIRDFHFSNKAGKEKLKNISIQIPVNEEGIFDIESQRLIVQKYFNIERDQQKLQAHKELLSKLLIEITLMECSYKSVKVCDIFIPENGNGDYTKKFCNDNKGIYPLYSGSSTDIFKKINTYDYDGKYLTWVKDGLAGYVMYHDEKFSITNHRGILIPKIKMDNIDLEYIKYQLEPLFRKACKGRVGYDGQNEYTTLNQTMINNIEAPILIPIDSTGEYDLKTQKEISLKYRKVDEIKKAISDQIDTLCLTEIKF